MEEDFFFEVEDNVFFLNEVKISFPSFLFTIFHFQKNAEETLFCHIAGK
jgi:hypothetical protein